MGTTHSTSDAYSPREFYLPATFQFSRGPGRIERFLRRLTRNADVPMVSRTETGDEEFYLPGTPQFRPRAR